MRSKVVALLLSLTALWGFAAFVTVREGLNLLSVATLDQGVAEPQETLLPALQEERRLTQTYLGSGSAADQQAMIRQRALTDDRIANFIAKSQDSQVRLSASTLLDTRLDQSYELMHSLADHRRNIDAGRYGRTDARAPYDTLIQAVLACVDAMSEVDDKDVARDARTLIQLTRARESLAQEDAVIQGALAEGLLTGTDFATFTKLVGEQRYLYTHAISELPDADRAAFEALYNGSQWKLLGSQEDKIITAGPTDSPVVALAAWSSAIKPVLEESGATVNQAGNGVAQRGTSAAIGVVLRVALVGVLGLLAVLASIVISITTARQLVGQLARLRNAARDLASYRLPRVVERLQQGEQVDVKQEAPPLDFGRDEIGQVGEAFNQVQETAIRVAVEQAELRRSVRDVFLSLARRSQALLHRQLGLLDAMERRSTDSEELAELFRIDHLATRMRRNAENLIVLSGATAGRAWRKPVPMVDVLRGALAEVEDYTRVTVLPVGNAALLGRAVGDVIHLLAELIENAVSFSPPQTTVRVGGSVVGYGFAIEIEDRGLGMSPEELAAANDQLRDPPEFRLTSTARLGIYVVGKLAERHGIRVRLTDSPYGGTTAIVLLPGSIMAEGDVEDPLDPAQLDSFRPAQLAGAGRHRLQSAVEERPAPRSASTAIADAPTLAPVLPPPATNGNGNANGSSNGHLHPTALVEPPTTSLAPGAPVMPVAEPPTTPRPGADPEPPKLTPSGLPWRQRRPSPSEATPSPESASEPVPPTAVADPTTPLPAAEPTPLPRDPDSTRSRMSSFRSGTLRGRTDAARLTEEASTGDTPVVAPVVVTPPTGWTAATTDASQWTEASLWGPSTDQPSTIDQASNTDEEAGR